MPVSNILEYSDKHIKILQHAADEPQRTFISEFSDSLNNHRAHRGGNLIVQ